MQRYYGHHDKFIKIANGDSKKVILSSGSVYIWSKTRSRLTMEHALKNILQATNHDFDLIFCGYSHETISYFNNIVFYNREITSLPFTIGGSCSWVVGWFTQKLL